MYKITKMNSHLKKLLKEEELAVFTCPLIQINRVGSGGVAVPPHHPAYSRTKAVSNNLYFHPIS